MTTTSAPATASRGVGRGPDRAARARGDRVGVGDDLRLGLVARRERRRGRACPRWRRRAGTTGPCCCAPSPRKVDGQAGEGALVLADRQQVGEQLAGVEVVAEGVDHGHGRAGRHLLQAGLARRCASTMAETMALEHAGRVGRGLLAAELAVRGGDDERAPAEVGDADGERDPRAGRRLVEDDGDGLRALERSLRPAVALELVGQVEHLGCSAGAQVVVAEEVAGHARPFRDGGEECG